MQRMGPPPLYDLTELQRHANRIFGFSAQHTLDTAQTLYERHKLISYPRTDSRHLVGGCGCDGGGDCGKRWRNSYRNLLALGTGGERPLGRRYVDDSEGHGSPCDYSDGDVALRRANLSPDEAKIYDLVCRRFLSCWHDGDHVWSVTTVITAIVNGEITDRYYSSGKTIQQVGWKVLDFQTDRNKSKKAKAGEETADASGEEQALPASLARGQAQDVVDAEAVRKKTRAPKRFTEATLLTAMETAGKTLDEKELSDAMKETGAGGHRQRGLPLSK